MTGDVESVWQMLMLCGGMWLKAPLVPGMLLALSAVALMELPQPRPTKRVSWNSRGVFCYDRLGELT